ncbi:N-acetyltransferase family protein [Rhodovibrionaceae bacterium A322]
MSEEIVVRAAGPSDSAAIAALVYQLLSEIMPADKLRTKDELQAAALELWDKGPGFAAYLAETQEGEAVGVLTLTEMCAIFALGCFGEVTELYVTPQWRSARVGEKLLDQAVEHAKAQNWTRLELTAPDETADGAQRAYAFYNRIGYEAAGPRLKISI